MKSRDCLGVECAHIHCSLAINNCSLWTCVPQALRAWAVEASYSRIRSKPGPPCRSVRCSIAEMPKDRVSTGHQGRHSMYCIRRPHRQHEVRIRLLSKTGTDALRDALAQRRWYICVNYDGPVHRKIPWLHDGLQILTADVTENYRQSLSHSTTCVTENLMRLSSYSCCLCLNTPTWCCLLSLWSPWLSSAR
jgi:hypothetical protein